MAIEKGTSFAGVVAKPLTPDEIMLEYIMDFCVQASDRMEELGMTRSELAKRLGKTPSQVTRVLGGRANITLATMAEYDAALGLCLSISRAPLASHSASERIANPTRPADEGSPHSGTATPAPSTTVSDL